MSIVGVFTRAEPSIGGLYFDASIEETTELVSEVSEFPIENGALGSDNVAQRPLVITMLVGVSDNPFRALSASANAIPGGALAGSLGGTAIGGVIGQLGGSAAAVAGLAGSVVNAAYAAGQAETRSLSVLEEMRAIQRAGLFVDVVTAKGKTYTRCLIRNTRQATNKENEQGLELVVELVQPLIVGTDPYEKGTKKEELAPEDPVETQGQPVSRLGEIPLQ
jgi:hypothetical protein